MQVVLWSNGLVSVFRKNQQVTELQGSIKDVGWKIIEESNKIAPEQTEYCIGDFGNGLVKCDSFKFKSFMEINFPLPKEEEKKEDA